MSEDESQIRDWLDPDVVEQIQSVDDGNRFNLNVKISGLNVNIMKPRENGPTIIISQITPGAATLANLVDRKTDREHLQTLLGSVLTNSPGVYNFLDSEGASCDFEDLRTIRIQYHIYPDELPQHSLMNGLMDITSALVFIQNSIAQYSDNLDSQR